MFDEPRMSNILDLASRHLISRMSSSAGQLAMVQNVFMLSTILNVKGKAYMEHQDIHNAIKNAGFGCSFVLGLRGSGSDIAMPCREKQ